MGLGVIHPKRMLQLHGMKFIGGHEGLRNLKNDSRLKFITCMTL